MSMHHHYDGHQQQVTTPNQFLFSCPKSLYITEIGGTASDSHIQSLYFRCSGRTKIKSQTFGTVEPAETPFLYSSRMGFAAISGAKTNNNIISLLPYNQQQQPLANAVGAHLTKSEMDDPKNGIETFLKFCPTGQVITGVRGEYNENGEILEIHVVGTPIDQLDIPQTPAIIRYLPWITLIVLVIIGLYVTYQKKCPQCPDQQYCRIVNDKNEPIFPVSKVVQKQ